MDRHRFAVVLALVALLAGGCVARTDHERGVSRASTAAGDAPAPVYHQPREIVFLACLRAAQAYFGRVDHEDQARGEIAIDNANFWAGDTRVEILVSEDEPGAWRVDVGSRAAGSNRPLWNRSRNDVDRFLTRVDLEVRTLVELRAQTSAASAPATAGAESASATSRP